MRRVAGAFAAALTLAFASPAYAGPATERAAILSTIARMQAAWNRGDFRGYMAGFRNPDVGFVSGGKFQDGGRARSIITSAITALLPQPAETCISTT